MSLALGAANAQTQKTTATPQTADELLAPVSWLVGGTWVTDVTDHDSTTHVENRIRWAPNHQAIEFNTDFNGKPHYNGFYAYDPVKKSIGFYYTSAEGELTIGTAAPDADGKTLHQDFDIMKPQGATAHLRSTIVRDGKNAYVFTVFLQKNGDWTPAFKIRYERKPE
ncbi:MAG: DUF1579 family protein [Acidobacteriaceae bacterium]